MNVITWCSGPNFVVTIWVFKFFPVRNIWPCGKRNKLLCTFMFGPTLDYSLRSRYWKWKEVNSTWHQSFGWCRNGNVIVSKSYFRGILLGHIVAIPNTGFLEVFSRDQNQLIWSFLNFNYKAGQQCKQKKTTIHCTKYGQ